MAEHNRFDPFEISSLIVRQISAEITSAEQEKLHEWLNADPKNAALLESLQDKQLWRKEISGMNTFDSQLALRNVLDKINKAESSILQSENYQNEQNITDLKYANSDRAKLNDHQNEQNNTTEAKPHDLQRDHAEPKRTVPLNNNPNTSNINWPYKYLSAAVLILCLGFLAYFLNSKPQKTNLASVKTTKPETITLTLSDGKKINLSAAANDTLINQGTANIKNQKGILSYESKAGQTPETSEQIYNTLRIPPGYQYQIILPDGSGVWLNAGSTLKFPVVFNTKERIVELSGEAYFEVKHLQDKPFSVKSATQTVEVLGTHFNIQAYPEDASTITTLAEGSVRISNGRTSAKLKPGQMVVNTSGSSELRPKEANLNEALAWTNGKFSFSDDRLEDIMKKVARRYQVEVEFQGDVKDKRFWGSYPINKGLKNLLKNLEQTNTVRFRLDGRRVIVTQ
ncbi:FecR domain-containing protein [Pedobacter sp. MC2016-15]|uniref:FecR family protein n=1 Tax=Pedobacter sp. MC2016-15 TaxID=2994473 RepID=UPI0022452D0E|nr:FecR domain-containing protein [Pedobacter sp. MC2016-15]MCX2477718.1 FecR domain-containing protein [Pedobacter sp. MC2016-15]